MDQAVQTNAEQGTALWHRERSQGIGGSEIAAIMGISPYTTAYKLWEEKTGRRQPENISNLPHVKRGINGEIVARIMIEREHNVSFKPKTWKIPGTHYRCSDDGYSLDIEVILEIKCMGKDKHEAMRIAAQTGDIKGIPEHYYVQCQYNLDISGAKECWFYSFAPEDETLHRVIVYPDPKLQAKIRKAVDKFWLEHVVPGIPPELSDGDYEAFSTEVYAKAAEEFTALKAEQARIEARLGELKDVILAEVGDRPAVRGHGLRIKTSERKGNIDYKSIPALKGIDLEHYRGKPIKVTQINLSAL